METQRWDGWDSAQSTPPKTDSSSEAKNKWADTSAKILRVREMIRSKGGMQKIKMEI